MAVVTCFGGVNEIGGNKILVEVNDTSIFLDFGYAFGAEAQYYEEFLQPRSSTKLHDLLELQLTPKIDGIYRQDALQPDRLDQLDTNPSLSLWESDLESYEEATANGNWTPDALFLSHAHLDHAGYLPYLGDIPIHCSSSTETVLETLVDLGHLTGFDGEFLELKPREIDHLSSGLFPGAPRTMRAEPISRSINHLEPGERTAIGTVDLEAFGVGHSIPGSLACLLEGESRQILYTGDLRFHGRTGVDLGVELEGLRPDVMLCEGTRIDETEPDDEQRVEDEIVDTVESTAGLAMVGFAWKDLERYETVKRAAERADRIPVVDPRTAYLKARFGESVYEEDVGVFVERSDSMLYSPGDYRRSKHKAGELAFSAWDSTEGVIAGLVSTGLVDIDVMLDSSGICQ